MTYKDINNLYKEFHTPLHVQKHCKTVAEFACKLADILIKKGIIINRELLEKAALIHDFVRYIDFRQFNPESWSYEITKSDIIFWKMMREKYRGMHHADAGADILRELGFSTIASIVRTHKFLGIQKGLSSWEEKLLYYADKRTKHDTVVSLRERLEDGKRRNAPDSITTEESKKVEEKVFLLEQEILTATGEVS